MTTTTAIDHRAEAVRLARESERVLRERQLAREVIPVHERMLRVAQENHDRVFGGQR